MWEPVASVITLTKTSGVKPNASNSARPGSRATGAEAGPGAAASAANIDRLRRASIQNTPSSTHAGMAR
ncbi:hypothetical protein G6F35_016645 [Rhizopus arrhizus]|nr:hypothetical protein G6F35_016645 [Rhizopus arrhizus]